MPTPNILIAEMITSFRARVAAFDAAIAEQIETDRAARVIVGQGWVVHAGGFAYNIRDTTCYPVNIEPSLAGVARYSRKDAEIVARLRGHGCDITHVSDLRRVLRDEAANVLATLEAASC